MVFALAGDSTTTSFKNNHSFTYVRAMVMSPMASRQQHRLVTGARLWHEQHMQQTLPSLSDAYAIAAAGRLDEALEIIRKHAASGDGEALFTLGDVHWRGTGTPRDLERGRDYFRQSSEAGFNIGQRAYTNLLGAGHAGECDWSKA